MRHSQKPRLFYDKLFNWKKEEAAISSIPPHSHEIFLCMFVAIIFCACVLLKFSFIVQRCLFNAAHLIQANSLMVCWTLMHL